MQPGVKFSRRSRRIGYQIRHLRLGIRYLYLEIRYRCLKTEIRHPVEIYQIAHRYWNKAYIYDLD